MIIRYIKQIVICFYQSTAQIGQCSILTKLRRRCVTSGTGIPYTIITASDVAELWWSDRNQYFHHDTSGLIGLQFTRIEP